MSHLTRVLVKIVIGFFPAVVFFYLLLPTHEFPLAPPDSVQSLEESDTETPYRRAYFTNFAREEVRNHYAKQIGVSFLLNYPPEDAFRLIRDQTRSTGLEEIVQPFRESLFINFFEPRNPKDAVSYRGIPYFQKITVKYSSTNLIIRITIIFTALVLLLFVFRELFVSIYDLLKVLFKKRS